MKDKMLRTFVEDTEIHRIAIEHSREKGQKMNVQNLLFQPETWEIIGEAIESGNYKSNAAEQQYVDKLTKKYITYDKAMERDFYKVRCLSVLPLVDRIISNAMYKVMYNEFIKLVDESCVSYRVGESTRTVARKINKALSKDSKKLISIKGDFEKFFDRVPREVIMELVDDLQEVSPSQLLEVTRDTYNDDRLIVNGELTEHYGSLKQGYAVASLFADLILRDVDKKMRTKYNVTYYRYCDDFIIIGTPKNAHRAFRKFVKMINKKGIRLNDSKTEIRPYYQWCSFLGFRFKENKVTISEDCIHNIRHKIKSETIFKCKELHRPLSEAEVRVAINRIQRYMFDSCKKCHTGMATYMYGANVNDHDINRIDEFVKDCIRASLTNHCDIYGIGCSYGEWGIVSYNYGKDVGYNRLTVTNYDIAHLGWYSLNHMKKKYLQGKDIYNSEILRMKNGEIYEIE